MDYDSAPNPKRRQLGNSTSPDQDTNIVILNVGGRKFHTIRETLESSKWLKSMADCWQDNLIRQSDGSIFVDADPEVFEHVLNFMRRPQTFPLFWSKEKGFDLAMYNKLAAEADYFLLHDLRDWIRAGTFTDAIKTNIIVQTQTLWPERSPDPEDRYDSNTNTVEVVHIRSQLVDAKVPKRYFCPSGFEDHYHRYDCDVIGCYRSYISESLNEASSLYDLYRESLGTLVTEVYETHVDMNVCVNN